MPSPRDRAGGSLGKDKSPFRSSGLSFAYTAMLHEAWSANPLPCAVIGCERRFIAEPGGMADAP